MNDMKRKMMTFTMYVLMSIMLGSVGFMMPGCKSQPKIQIIDNKEIVTNHVPAKAFNDEKYVWENFYFSTNRVTR